MVAILLPISSFRSSRRFSSPAPALVPLIADAALLLGSSGWMFWDCGPPLWCADAVVNGYKPSESTNLRPQTKPTLPTDGVALRAPTLGRGLAGGGSISPFFTVIPSNNWAQDHTSRVLAGGKPVVA